jgi:DNA-binding SARP family transcriptional activator
MLACLLTNAGRPVSVDAIVDAIWGEDPPTTATGTLQSYVSRLRNKLPDGAIERDTSGYRLVVDDDDVDHLRFERLADEGRRLLEVGDISAAAARFVEADALWRGPALAELADEPFATGLATRLDQRRLAALEDRFQAELALGHHAALVGELTETVAAHPLRERLQEQLALALYRSGRQADALRAVAEAGRTLRDELGIEPGRGLRDLEAAMLDQDPALDHTAPAMPDKPAAPDAEPDASHEPAPPVTGSLPLVGRGPELAELRQLHADAAASTRFVVIEGEPGIGKTRLADELRLHAEHHGSIVVWGRSDEGGAAPALWPWLPPLRAIAAAADEVPAALSELLEGSTPMSTGQAVAAQFERFEAVAELIRTVAARRPVVILLDDLQWADATSLELLAFLASGSAVERGVLVVATMRELPVGRNDAVTDALSAIARRSGSRRLRLRGLSADATAEILDAAARRSIATDIAATIHERAEGNPFYAIELARLLDEEGEGVGDVPGSVGDVIRRRIAQLPGPTNDLLSVAAVVGRDVDLTILAGADDSTVADVADHIDAAVAHRLLVEVPDRPGELRFSHALVREVLLADMTSLRRARLHLKVADAIEAAGADADQAEILAEHLWRAAPVGVGQRAAEALEAAAEVATRRVAYASAENLLSRAVQLRRAAGRAPVQQEAELLAIVRLLEVARARRYFQGASDLGVMDRAKALAEQCDRRDLLLILLWFEWSALATSCRRTEGDPLARAYIDLTRDDERLDLRASSYQIEGVWHWGRGRVGAAADALDQAMSMLAEADPPDDPFVAEQWMVAQTFWIFTHVLTGRIAVDDAFARFDAMLDAAPDRFAITSVCGFAATTAVALGEWERIDRYSRISIEADPGTQFAFWGGQALMQSGIARVREGEIDAGLASFADGRARYLGIGGRSAYSSFEATLALALLGQGRIEEAATAATAARVELDTYEESWNTPIVLMAEAALAHAQGDAARARALLHESLAVAVDQDEARLVDRIHQLAADLGLELDADA